MKKIVLLVLCLILSGFCLTSCRKDDEPFEEKTYTSDTQISEICLDVRDREIEVSLSEDNRVHIQYFENSKEYYDMKPTEEILTRAAIAKTLLQLSQYVTFTVDGKPLVDASGANVGAMNLDSFVENPGEQINSSQKATLKLYFSNKAGTRLVPETREVHYSSNISLEKLVMEQLIEGPRKSGLLATIPSETKLITITVVDGVCYVNLDEMFLNQNQEISEPVVLYSIVDSLTELTGIDKVQISINGDTSGKCRYTYKLSKMYKADDRLVTKESDEKVESTE